MTLDEYIAALQALRDQHGGDLPVVAKKDDEWENAPEPEVDTITSVGSWAVYTATVVKVTE